ncbi:GNAT family acetyltransferase [Acidipropionibacterium acidipropionici]|uniref:GNAT family acetyltransferase n=1 Tax=Acidipropionibacterium acidipropionici TaxID=1748 RepID=A0AAC9AP62_9ACTN|nr:hypothetical protein [Acidipropionibacterium acidipropionici]AMS06594.1 GNAT family acetyltransferase [Acidipropionibacterium acidipropionici]AOZ45381.1 GNAT family acetyltransferase [Acidipropionibacterium acidipropionici]AZP38609.1 GNAT family acetyltransferase [Acidipropionibacterium acidipropionici]
MPVQLISPGILNLIVFLALAAFGVIAWFSIRHNIHGIDFDEVPSGPKLKSGPDRGEEGSGETGPRQ